MCLFLFSTTFFCSFCLQQFLSVPGSHRYTHFNNKVHFYCTATNYFVFLLFYFALLTIAWKLFFLLSIITIFGDEDALHWLTQYPFLPLCRLCLCRVWLWTPHIINSHRKEYNRQVITTTTPPWTVKRVPFSHNINSSNSRRAPPQYTGPMAICPTWVPERDETGGGKFNS